MPIVVPDRVGSSGLISIDLRDLHRTFLSYIRVHARDDSSTGSARKLREGVILEPNEALCETLIIAGRHSREETLRANSLTSLTVRLICVFI